MSVPPPPYSSTCAAVNTFLTSCTAASQQATTTSARIRAGASGRRAPRRLAPTANPASSSEVSIKKPGPWPRLVEGRHDELAVAGLPPMRTPVRAVVAAERAVAQAPAHVVADGRHVVDLRRRASLCAQRRQPSGTSPANARHVHDSLRDLAPHELGLDRSTPGTPPDSPSSSGSSQGRRSPCAPDPQSLSCARVPRRRLASVSAPGAMASEQLLVVDLGVLARARSPYLPGCGGSPGSGNPSAARSSLISQSAAVFHSRCPEPRRPFCAPRDRAADGRPRESARRRSLRPCATPPSLVVVETPVRIDGHAGDHVGLDGNEIEERRREIGALIRGARRAPPGARASNRGGCDRGRESVSARRPSTGLIPGMISPACISS